MSFLLDPHEIFGGGIYRLMSANNPEFPQDSVVDAYNMIYERSREDLEKMQGYTRLGTNTVNGAVTGLFDYADGTELIAGSADGGIYKRTTGDWAAVAGGAAATFSTTATARWSGRMAYGTTTGARLLILSNGVDAPQKYTSGAGASALGGTPPSTGKFFIPFGGRYWLFTGDTAHYSAADNVEDWTTAGGSFQIDRGSGDITGAAVLAGNLLIFKRRSILRLLPGTTLSGTSVRGLTTMTGTSSHHTIAETTGSVKSGTLFFRSDEGIHEISPTAATGGFYISNAAEPIKPVLDRQDTANLATNWGLFNPARGEYWLHYTLNDSSPDEGVIGNMARGKKPRWTSHDMRNKTAGCMYISSGAQVQIIGDGSGLVYQMHTGIYNRAGAGYRGYVTLPSYTQGNRSRMKLYGRIFLDAETNGTYPILAYYSLGRSGLPGSGGGLNQPSDFGASDGWGAGKWGVATWGGSSIAGQWYRLEKVRRGSYIRLRFETLGADQWFRLNGLGIEYAMKRAVLAA